MTDKILNIVLVVMAALLFAIMFQSCSPPVECYDEIAQDFYGELYYTGRIICN